MKSPAPVAFEESIILNHLEPLAASGADSRQVADSAIAVWGAIDAALAPVIGPQGMAALYKRSLQLARADYTWLGPVSEDAACPGDFTSLKSALLQQTPAAGAAAHDAMVQTLRDLLVGLVGGSLAQRLLQPVWGQP